MPLRRVGISAWTAAKLSRRLPNHPTHPQPVPGKEQTRPEAPRGTSGSWTAINCNCQVGSPIRISPDQSPFPAPRSFSQGITSFIASCCQGIHQTPFSRLIRPGTGTARGCPRVPPDRSAVYYPCRSPLVRWTAAVSVLDLEQHRLRTGLDPCRYPATAGYRRCRCFSLNDVNSSPKAGRQATHHVACLPGSEDLWWSLSGSNR